MRNVPLAFAVLAIHSFGANAQQMSAVSTPPTRSTADFLSEGYEVRGVINNTYLILQKGNQTYLCGSRDPALTWANWAEQTRNAGCVSLTK